MYLKIIEIEQYCYDEENHDYTFVNVYIDHNLIQPFELIDQAKLHAINDIEMNTEFMTEIPSCYLKFVKAYVYKLSGFLNKELVFKENSFLLEKLNKNK